MVGLILGVKECINQMDAYEQQREQDAVTFCSAFDAEDESVGLSCKSLVANHPTFYRVLKDKAVRPCVFAGMPSVCRDATGGTYYEWAKGVHVFVLVVPERSNQSYTRLILPSETIQKYTPPISYLND